MSKFYAGPFAFLEFIDVLREANTSVSALHPATNTHTNLHSSILSDISILSDMVTMVSSAVA
jgi:hypothetical protein